MATQTGFRWVKTPAALRKAIEEYGARALDVVMEIAEYIAQKAQDEARRNASWHDRTGNARSGLFGKVGVEDRNASGDFVPLAQRIVTVYLCHTMNYGVYLELCNAGKYAIIMPTLEKLYPEVERMLKQAFQ